MLKMVLGTEKGRLLILGFSRLNLEKLQQGMPVDIDLTVPGMEDIRHVVIYGGETEATMAEEIKKSGLMSKKPH